MRRLPRTLRRLAPPALAVVLVVAHAVGAFGFPMVRGKNVRACGCVVPCGTAPSCCCSAPAADEPRCPRCPAPTGATPGALVEVAAEPGVRVFVVGASAEEPPPARDCCAKADDGVTWVSAIKARQCRGESPAGALAETPAVPPVVPVAAPAYPIPTAFPPPADAGRPHVSSDPSDPPPRG